MAGGYQLYRHMAWRDRPITGDRSSAVQQALDLIKMKYVDSIALDSIETAGLYAITRNLDPHSVFIPAANISDVEADLAGNFSGIGVEYMMVRDTVLIVNVLEKGPAAQAGLLVGDAIIKVNDSTIAGIGIQGTSLRGLLRGKRASTVKVTVLRDGATLEKTITRGEVPLTSLDASYMIAPAIGYIRLNRFAETTFFEFMDAATALNEKGMKQLIFDLRGNGGGLLDEATKIADELLEDGLTIVSTRGARTKDMTVTATKPGLFEKGDIVLLIDEQSASASEVIAGALQDHDRATIIGRRSFGKGLVQEQYKLSNGGALRLTIARYFTPLGRGIQKPYNNGYEAYLEQIVKSVHNGAEIQQADTMGLKVFVTKKGKRLYEFGGIMPDIWVPFDSTILPLPVRKLYNSNILGETLFNMYRKNKERFSSYSDIATFEKEFTVDPAMWKYITEQALTDSIDLSMVQGPDRQKVEERIKAMLARYRWRNQGFYQVINYRDAAVQKALAYLQPSN